MSDSENEQIALYHSSWCSHSRSVEHFLDRNNIAVRKINIDGDHEAREELIRLNDGFASVPTLVFPDGEKLTEPSLDLLRKKLNLEDPSGLTNRLRSIFGLRG